MSESSGLGGGIGFVELLTILFIALKLTGYVNWPWIWVLSPLWISASVGVLIVVCVLAFNAFERWMAS
jgi:hypothetical protein